MKLKIVVLAAVSVFALSSAASAADLPSRRLAPAPVAAAPVFVWSGLYAGLQLGYAWDRVNWNIDAALPGWTVATPGSEKKSGVVGGGHVGYLFQPGPVVLGLEADLEGSSIQGSGIRGSGRARLGFAFDRTLVYATGGVAFTQQSYNRYNTAFGASTYNTTAVGWTAGAGVECMIAQNWSARLEYRYSDFGKASFSTPVASLSTRRTENAVRLGVSYHFSAPSAPVVAKY